MTNQTIPAEMESSAAKRRGFLRPGVGGTATAVEESRPRRRWGIYIALVVYTIIILAPFYWVLLMSLKNPSDVTANPPKFFFTPTLDNYRIVLGLQEHTGLGEVIRMDFPMFFRNSLIVVPASLVLAMILGVPVAYVLARMEFKARDNFAFFYLSLYFMPAILILIPLYVLYRTVHLFNTYQGLILILQLVNLPMVVWILRGFFEDIPKELEESALVDGYTWPQAIWRVSLPLIRPGIVTTGLLSFIFSWHNFIFGLILASTEKQPVTVGILNFVSYERVLWGQMAAATMITALPVLIFALMIQKYIVRGLTLGAVKG